MKRQAKIELIKSKGFEVEEMFSSKNETIFSHKEKMFFAYLPKESKRMITIFKNYIVGGKIPYRIDIKHFIDFFELNNNDFWNLVESTYKYQCQKLEKKYQSGELVLFFAFSPN